jgi:hypothetical protein
LNNNVKTVETKKKKLVKNESCLESYICPPDRRFSCSFPYPPVSDPTQLHTDPQVGTGRTSSDSAALAPEILLHRIFTITTRPLFTFPQVLLNPVTKSGATDWDLLSY